MRRRQQRAESYLQDLERLMEASTQLVARTPRSGPLNMDTKFGVDMLLLSAKHTMVAALEIDGGIAPSTITSAAAAGANRLVVGSAMFRDPEGFEHATAELRSLASAATI